MQTPLERATLAGREVWLKREDVHELGAFKWRGALPTLEGFRDQGERPAYSAPRIRIQHEDRRVSVHPGGCHRLQIAGAFIHVERFGHASSGK